MSRALLCSLAIGATVTFSCGGKVIVDGLGPDGAGGAGGHPTGSTASSSSHASSSHVAVSSTGSAAQTSSSSGPACDPSETCLDAITPPGGDPKKLCAPAAKLYSALFSCICGGNCKAACGANTCIGKTLTLNCQMCVQDLQKGCGKEYSACNMN